MIHHRFSIRSALSAIAVVGTLLLTPLSVIADDFKAALVMPGSINDGSWNETGYESLMRAEKELGIEVAYSERVAHADQMSHLNDYARRGYDVVMGHGGEFLDSIQRAAKQNPDTLFVLTNGFIDGENIASVTFDFKQFGYAIGYLGARMSETGKGSYISAQRIQVATDLEDGFKQGFRSVHPEAEIPVTYTDDWDDVALARQAALSHIDRGVDVVFPLLDNAQVGALKAAQETDTWSFGVWADVHDEWPDAALQSAVMDFRIALVDFLETARDGEAEAKVYKYGIGTEAGRLGTYNDAIPDDIVKDTEEVIRKLKDGEIRP